VFGHRGQVRREARARVSRKRRRVLERALNVPVVDVRTFEQIERERQESRALGSSPVRRRPSLTPAEQAAAEKVRRVQGEPPPW
jgi:hypothetical protein